MDTVVVTCPKSMDELITMLETLHESVVYREFKELFNRYTSAMTSMRDEDNRTLLHHAVMENQERVVALLMKRAPQLINEQDDDGNTALFYAVASNRNPLIYQMLQHKVTDVTVANNFQETAYAQCYSEHYTNVFISTLLKIGGERDYKDCDADEDESRIRCYLHAHYDLHGRDICPCTQDDENYPLYRLLYQVERALCANEVKEAQERIADFMEYDGHPNYNEIVGNFIGRLIVFYPSRCITPILLLLKLYTHNTLHLLIRHGHLVVAKMVIENDLCNLTYRDSNGRSALHYACMQLRESMTPIRVVKLLFAKGLDPYEQDNLGKTSFDYTRGYTKRTLLRITSAHHPKRTTR